MTGCLRRKAKGMRHEIRYVNTTQEQIELFCRFARDHQTDFKLPHMKKFLKMDFQQLCNFVTSKYLRETGEQILRPAFFAEIGSDCDDATIFLIALFLAAGIDEKDILIVEAKESPNEKEYVHIFCALKDPNTGKPIWFDNLPGTEFNRIPYSMKQLRITPLTDYL